MAMNQIDWGGRDQWVRLSRVKQIEEEFCLHSSLDHLSQARIKSPQKLHFPYETS
jgi:hypothetical protein